MADASTPPESEYVAPPAGFEVTQEGLVYPIRYPDTRLERQAVAHAELAVEGEITRFRAVSHEPVTGDQAVLPQAGEDGFYGA